MSAFAKQRRSPARFMSALAVLLACLGLCPSEGRARAQEVVVYTSVDQFFSEPILKDFEAATGIRVRAVFDVEAARTTGLANRLVAERSRPRADVFWNGEFVQTARLMQEGVLAPFVPERSAGAAPAPEARYWTSFGGRARVLIVNTMRLKPGERPDTLMDLASDKWPAREIGIAYPLFGTTATHAAALYATWGPEKARAFFAALAGRGVRFVDGNSVVRDLVASGHLSFGLTDSDDACAAKARGLPVEVRFPDQAQGAAGTFVIPNTVALIRGAPNPEPAGRLINYLLGPEVARKLAASGWFHVDGSDVIAPGDCGLPPKVKAFPVSQKALADMMERMQRELKDLIVR
jgi:iron(III) transport system substrate-binding protein